MALCARRRKVNKLIVGLVLMFSVSTVSAMQYIDNPVGKLKGNISTGKAILDVVCIDSYQYLVVRVSQGVAVTQMYKSDTGGTRDVPKPIECK